MPTSDDSLRCHDLENQAQRLREHVMRLASSPRPYGSPEHQQAKDYVRQHLEAEGFRVMESVHEEAGFRCANLLTAPYPDDETLPLLLVAAHYDSVPDSPGADDNASA